MTMLRWFHRGTVPYRAKVRASITVDLPDPVGADQDEVVGVGEVDDGLGRGRRRSRASSSRTGRIVSLPSGAGELVVQPLEQRLHPRVGDAPAAQKSANSSAG